MDSVVPTISHFFVDEAGDLTLFDSKGRSLLGREGVSWTFMVGVAKLPEPALAHERLESLRRRLLADPYFRSVPSMQPDAKKTAVAFHAKDDLPEVRREVLSLLPSLNAKVIVAIRRKAALTEEARAAFSRGSRIGADDVYDDLVKRLFKELLHKGDENRIMFARRGKRDRQEALRDAIAHARRNFARKWGDRGSPPTDIRSGRPSDAAGLQVVDYYLWALQRLFERREDRFFEVLRPGYRVVMDLDDRRHKPYGEWYTEKHPLTLEKMASVAG